jgi:hypothetical protein
MKSVESQEKTRLMHDYFYNDLILLKGKKVKAKDCGG